MTITKYLKVYTSFISNSVFSLLLSAVYEAPLVHMESQRNDTGTHLNSDFECTSKEMQNDGSQSYHNLLSYEYVVYYTIAQSVNFNALIHVCNLAEILLLWEL